MERVNHAQLAIELIDEALESYEPIVMPEDVEELPTIEVHEEQLVFDYFTKDTTEAPQGGPSPSPSPEEDKCDTCIGTCTCEKDDIISLQS